MPFNTLAEFLSLLDKVKPGTAGHYMACCPGHLDGHGPNQQSLSISLNGDKILLKCFAGCETPAIVQAMHLEMKDLFLTKEGSVERAQISQIYDYTDEQGKLLYQVVRYIPKAFKQRRPDGKGDWIWSLYESDPQNSEKKKLAVRLVLFHLPKIIECRANNKAIFVVEGEKDVLNLEHLGVYATCNPMGAGKWKDEYSKQLKGSHLIVIPDNDPPNSKTGISPGISHAQHVCKSLKGIAASVRYLVLPGEGVKDASNWIEQGGTKEKLKELIEYLPEWEPQFLQEDKKSGLPEINTTSTRLRDLTEQSLDALKAANAPPVLFVRAGQIARVVKDEHELPIVYMINESALRGRMERSANFVRTTSKGNVMVDEPPLEVVRDLINLGNWPFPPLIGITETPIIHADGTILSEAGYDPETELCYVPGPNFNMPIIAEKPSIGDIKKATDLLKEVICDFPFDCETSETNCIATMITPALRNLIHGPVPMALFDKPQAGTGASLLAESLSVIATGRTASMITAPKEDEEWRKIITSVLASGSNIIVIDNIENTLYSASLSKLLTNETWKDRLLGKTEILSFPHRSIWIGTGNNIHLGGDLPRRCYKSKLDAKEAKPWQRTGFKHPYLIRWTKEHRGDIIAAILTMAKAWIQAGKPHTKGLPILGGFEGWVETIGNILAFSNLNGFLGNLQEIYDDTDEDTSEWENFISAWYSQIGSGFITVAQIVDRIKANKILSDALPLNLTGDVNDKGFTRKFGKLLSKRADVRYPNDLIIKKGKTEARALTWAIHPLNTETNSQNTLNSPVSQEDQQAAMDGKNNSLNSALDMDV